MKYFKIGICAFLPLSDTQYEVHSTIIRPMLFQHHLFISRCSHDHSNLQQTKIEASQRDILRF